MKFFQDKRSRVKIIKTFDRIGRDLYNIDSEVAMEYLSWLERKTTLFRQSVDKSGYGKQPDDLSRGDIVWVEFGINVGAELSDYATKGHYAIVWAVDLGNVIVIPLTSKPSVGSSLTYELGIIPGLINGYDANISYVKLDAIRSISKRRIGRMATKDGGKVKLSDDIIANIANLIKTNFVDNVPL